MILKSTIGIVSPAGDQNYILNPSGEIAGNFAQLAGTTVTRVTTYQKYGLYSYEVNANANNEGISLTLLAYPNAAAFVTVRVRGQLPPAWDASLDNTNYHDLRLLERIDLNWSLYGAIIPASQANGSTTLYIRQNGAGSGLFYLDGVQVSGVIEGRYHSTYIDGTQEGCAWLGAPNASASSRSADSRAGGVVKSFWEGYGFFPEKALGMGAAVEELNIDSYAFLPGGELNSSKIPPREFSIIGFFLGDTVEELHEKAQALELELGLDTYPARQPVRFRYSGARVQKEIAARYAGGLEGDLPIFYNDDQSVEDEKWVKNFKFKMRASIQFIATDPFWYEIGESATLLDTNDTATFRYVAARLRSTGQWSNLGPPNAAGTYTAVYATAEDATYIYFGGDFLNFDNIAAADYIVRYNKQTGVYSALDVGLNGIVYALALAPNGDLYIGGEFTNAGGVAAADYLTVWNGTAFAAVGTPLTGAAAITRVKALAFDGVGNLYIGGLFANWNNIANADNIVMWNGSIYSALSTGTSDEVWALAIGLDKTTLYVGGVFATAGGVTVNDVAEWNGSAFTDLNGGSSGIVQSLAVDPATGLLYIGGSFTTLGGVTCNSIGAWNGTTILNLGSGVAGGGVNWIAIGADGTVYLGGSFTSAGGLTLADRTARWNGYSWSPLDIDLPGSPNVFSVLASRYVDPVVPQKYNLWLGFSTTGTGAFAGLETAQNDGTISAFPKITFSRSGGTTATLQTLRNERTGRELLFNYALQNGESLTIDLNPKNRTIVSSFFGPRMDARLKNDDFSIWQLLPGENDVSAFVSTAGSPTVTGYLLFREPFKSWN